MGKMFFESRKLSEKDVQAIGGSIWGCNSNKQEEQDRFAIPHYSLVARNYLVVFSEIVHERNLEKCEPKILYTRAYGVPTLLLQVKIEEKNQIEESMRLWALEDDKLCYEGAFVFGMSRHLRSLPQYMGNVELDEATTSTPCYCWEFVEEKDTDEVPTGEFFFEKREVSETEKQLVEKFWGIRATNQKERDRNALVVYSAISQDYLARISKIICERKLENNLFWLEYTTWFGKPVLALESRLADGTTRMEERFIISSLKDEKFRYEGTFIMAMSLNLGMLPRFSKSLVKQSDSYETFCKWFFKPDNKEE